MDIKWQDSQMNTQTSEDNAFIYNLPWDKLVPLPTGRLFLIWIKNNYITILGFHSHSKVLWLFE